MEYGTNAQCKPEFEGQIVKFESPHDSRVTLFDIAARNPKYGHLEWHALNEPTQQQIKNAFWVEG